MRCTGFSRPVGEDLGLDLLDVLRDRFARGLVRVDDAVDDRVHRRARTVGEDVGTLLQLLADVAEPAAFAVPDGDEEVVAREEHHLADVDDLLVVAVHDGLEDEEQGVAVLLELGTLVRLDRVLDRKLVQVELAAHGVELLLGRLDEADPDERVVGRLAVADPFDRPRVPPAAACPGRRWRSRRSSAPIRSRAGAGG